MQSPSLRDRAQSLLRDIVGGYDSKYGFGAMSCAVYDTAWVSLVTKPVPSTAQPTKEYLFPQSFQYILDAQLPSGDWAATGSAVDGILNTAASLLSLSRHLKEPLQLQTLIAESELQSRISRATDSLKAQLQTWDVSTASHVGFEIIVPALLTYLQDEGFSFVFPGREELLRLQSQKLSGFKPAYLYTSQKSTALHSLEAFVGVIEFDKVAHHAVLGAMMASPSSTAAYLMHASTWDEDAEGYLRHVVSLAQGGVPSAYPSTFFEYTWIISTLLRAGFSRSDLEGPELDTVLRVLRQGFEDGGGVIGFAPSLGSDVDDTAKGIIMLSKLTSTPLATTATEAMIHTFFTPTHFRTYAGERNASFSANCNALLALLHCGDPARWGREIGVVVGFLCGEWWGSDGGVVDKWNTSHLYPTLLLVEAFTDLLHLLQTHSDLLSSDLTTRAAIAVYQACLRTLLQQQTDGSWAGSTEKTAYGVGILAEARKLAFFQADPEVAGKVQDGIDTGVRFIHAAEKEKQGEEEEYLWIEKVSYRSPFVTEAYILAALRAAATPSSASIGRKILEGVGGTDKNKTKAHLKLFQATPLFSSLPSWQLRASLLESQLFAPLLRTQRLATFPREGMEEDKYFDLIPFTWTACNNRSHTFAATSLLYEMMVLSFLNYQADEFMEAVAGPAFAGDLKGLRGLIDGLFDTAAAADNNDDDANQTVITAHTHTKVHTPLQRFVQHVIQHPAVRSASAWDARNVRRQLRIFLQAHVTQTEDNEEFAAQQNQQQEGQQGEIYTSASQTFFEWVRSTSADHTSCPYSFAFISCLIAASVSPSSPGCFQTAEQKYLAEAACRHLATMCRMYNDYGSIARDAAEGNLNSVNFPEFETATAASTAQESKKKALFNLASYEREGLNEALRRLESEVEAAASGKRKMQIFRMFVDVTDLYGQIYVVRDVASRMKGAGVGAGVGGNGVRGNGSHFATGNGIGNGIGIGVHPNGNGGTNGVKRKSELAVY